MLEDKKTKDLVDKVRNILLLFIFFAVCGWIYEGEELPDDIVCPLCKHGAADFEPI